MYTVANIILQYGVNSLGSDAIAGNVDALNYESFAYFTMVAFQNAAVTFISQNHGAHNQQRCRSAMRWCLGLSAAVLFVMCSLFLIFRMPLAYVFTTDPVVAEIAALKLWINLRFYAPYLIGEMLSGGMRGYGYSTLPATISVFGICAVRVIWVFFVFPTNRTFAFLSYAYPVSWFVTVGFMVAAYFYVVHKVCYNTSAD